MHAGCAGLSEDPISGWICPQHAVNGSVEEAPRKKKLKVVLGGRSKGMRSPNQNSDVIVQMLAGFRKLNMPLNQLVKMGGP